METSGAAYRPRNGLEVEDMGDEVLIYVPGTDRTILLNETAALVWRLCDGRRTVGEISDLLAQAYPESDFAIRQQVRDTLSDFVERGLIETGH
jgi:pyrroloquinoline quinone biosynthesis protein D